MPRHHPAAPITHLDDDLLRQWPLPMPAADGDKEERGRILIVGGARQMPGAVILAANAAMRAGAGKLTIATGASVAHLVALAVPESRVIGMAETAGGGIPLSEVDTLAAIAAQFDAVLIGPGMQDETAIGEFVDALLPRLSQAKVVLDAYAMTIVQRRPPGSQTTSLLLTPHAGEMAHLTGATKEDVLAAPCEAACDAARRWNALVALKGAVTFIATPGGRVWRHEGGNSGLAISGSGDTLAGIISGLAARGAPLEQACAWGVALHARAGVRLAERLGPLGYLAREIADEVPALMHALAAANQQQSA